MLRFINLILILISLILFSPVAQSANNEYVTGVSELGAPFKLLKSEWPKAFTCKHWGGNKAGKFMFSIRKKSTIPIGNNNAWLIFSDHTGYSGELYRNGLDWRFDWTDRKTSNKFSMKIKSGGEGYYFNWSLADSSGVMHVDRTATCN